MTMVGQYEIRDLLGAGGIGQVHAAFDTILQREVAIKSLRTEMLNDTSFVDRFRGEATSLARLNHPNITTLYTLLPEGGKMYLIMECVRGETLEDLLKKRGGKLGARESLAIIAQVADGLSYAHSMGVIHRDIKPANVMITANGTVKIMDFGIARVRGSQRLTRDGSIVGTLAYMAPEQLRGQEADERSDLYSTAIMFYEMISGAVPFEAATDYDLMQAHVNAQPPRLISRVPGIDSRLDAAVMQALAKKPEQRFATVRKFSDALGATALRPDASQIFLDSTRVIEAPSLEPPAEAPSASSALTHFLDRLTFIPANLRLLAVLGAGGVTLAALAVGLIVVAKSGPSSAPAVHGAASSLPGAAAPASDPSRRLAKATTMASADLNAVPAARTNSASAAPSVAGTPPPTPKTEMSAALSRQDFRRAAELADPLARGGDRDAQYALGVISDRGLNGTKNETLAADYYLKAAQQGHAKAAFKLASMYATGRGVDRKSDEQAFHWYLKAAEAGNVDGEYSVAAMYQGGRGVEKSDVQAFNWFLKAAEQGDVDAAYSVGALYQSGTGVEKSNDHAFDWYLKAAKLGNPNAQNSVGVFYTLGLGTARSDSDAVYWFHTAAEKGYAKAEKNLGDMYFYGRGVSQQDSREAFDWYKRAADQNDAAAELAVGKYYEQGISPVDRNYEQAADWYGKSAKQNNAQAQIALASLRSKGLIKKE